MAVRDEHQVASAHGTLRLWRRRVAEPRIEQHDLAARRPQLDARVSVPGEARSVGHRSNPPRRLISQTDACNPFTFILARRVSPDIPIARPDGPVDPRHLAPLRHRQRRRAAGRTVETARASDRGWSASSSPVAKATLVIRAATSGWTRDLRAAGHGLIRWPNGGEWRFTASLLQPGAERERAIRATSQHPFPGNVVYRLGRRHVRREGVFFRLVQA